MDNKYLLKEPTPYQLGIVFSLYRFQNKKNRVIFTHSNRYFLEQIKNLFIGNIEKYTVKPSMSVRYRLIICPCKALTKYFKENELLEKNLTTLPKLKDYHDFLRAYIEVNGILYFKYYHKEHNNYEFKHRLKLTANENILKQIRENLMIDIGININPASKIHKTSTGMALIISKINTLKKIYNAYKDDEEKYKNFWNTFSEYLNMEHEKEKYINVNGKR